MIPDGKNLEYIFSQYKRKNKSKIIFYHLLF